MQLKNKNERERFLEDYRSWELWKEIPELELKFYRKVLPNGTVIIATEYACMKFTNYVRGRFEYKKSTSVNFHLLLADSENFKAQYSDENSFKLYNPSGDRKSSIVEYLTKVKPEV